MGRSLTASCSFCGKHSSDVGKLVAGPGVYICNECVELCADAIAQVEKKPESFRPRSDPASSERLLAWLPDIANTLRAVERDIVEKVERLRRDGVRWESIAKALGLTEEEALKRFGEPGTGR